MTAYTCDDVLTDAFVSHYSLRSIIAYKVEEVFHPKKVFLLNVFCRSYTSPTFPCYAHCGKYKYYWSCWVWFLYVPVRRFITSENLSIVTKNKKFICIYTFVFIPKNTFPHWGFASSAMVVSIVKWLFIISMNSRLSQANSCFLTTSSDPVIIRAPYWR